MGDADGGRAALEQKRRKVEAKLAEIVGIQHQLCFTVYDYQEGRSGPQLDRKLCASFAAHLIADRGLPPK